MVRSLTRSQWQTTIAHCSRVADERVTEATVVESSAAHNPRYWLAMPPTVRSTSFASLECVSVQSSAVSTAAWSSACTSTLRRRCRAACRTAARTDRVQRCRLRQEREDAATVVVDDDDPQVGVAAGQRDERTAVVDERDVAEQHDRRCARRAPARAPSTARRRCRWRPGCVRPSPATAEPLEVADRHRRRHDQLGVVRQASATVRATAGSVSSEPASTVIIALGARSSAWRHRAIHGVAATSQTGEVVERCRTPRGHVAVGVDHPRAADLEHAARSRGRPLRQHLRRRRSTDPTMTSGSVGVGERLVPQQGVERSRPRSGIPHPDIGSARTGHPSRSTSAATAPGHSPAPTGDDHAPLRSSSARRSPVDCDRARHRAGARSRGLRSGSRRAVPSSGSRKAG
jgi:hypothetical protein